MPKTTLPETPYGHLPPGMRLLYVCHDPDSEPWLADRFLEDSAVDVRLEAQTPATTMTLLREEAYDAVLIGHAPERLDAIELVPLIRAGSREDQPIVVLGWQSAEEMTALCLETSADAYLCVAETSVRTLLWQIARARERHLILADNRRLSQSLEQQRSRQHREALQQLREQRLLLTQADCDGEDMVEAPPAWLLEHFRQLLRIYVVTGCGNLEEDVAQLVDRLVQCEVTLREALVAHTAAVEELVQGLRNRSAWHAISRGNLLAYELVLQLTSSQLITE